MHSTRLAAQTQTWVRRRGLQEPNWQKKHSSGRGSPALRCPPSGTHNRMIHRRLLSAFAPHAGAHTCNRTHHQGPCMKLHSTCFSMRAGAQGAHATSCHNMCFAVETRMEAARPSNLPYGTRACKTASLCPPVVGAPVGEHHCSATHSKQAVGDEHGALIAKVPILCDVLSAQHQAILVGVHLHRWDTSYIRLCRKSSHQSAPLCKVMRYNGNESTRVGRP